MFNLLCVFEMRCVFVGLIGVCSFVFLCYVVWYVFVCASMVRAVCQSSVCVLCLWVVVCCCMACCLCYCLCVMVCA